VSTPETEPGRDLLSAHLDGELTDAERAAVDEELATSAEWREELADVRAARDSLRGLPEREAPDGFWAAVHVHVAADPDGDLADAAVAAPVPITAARSRRAWRWVAAGVAVAAAVVAIIVVPHRNEVSPNVTAVIAQHGAQGSDTGEPVSMLAPVGPLAGFRR
jgi:negative regulator of sigma E activity